MTTPVFRQCQGELERNAKERTRALKELTGLEPDFEILTRLDRTLKKLI